jgi:uncharacterized damage-inducible protein DinB
MLTPSQIGELVLKAMNGDPWYGSSTSRVLAGLSAGEVLSHPVVGAHSIWEIVLHMTAWRREVGRRLAGSRPGPPREGDWPPITDETEAAWARARGEFTSAGEELATSITSLNPEIWSRSVGEGRAAELGTGVSFGEMVIGVLQHDAYHTGQMALMGKLLIRAEGEPK